MSYMKQNEKRKQTLENEQNGLEIIFKCIMTTKSHFLRTFWLLQNVKSEEGGVDNFRERT